MNRVRYCFVAHPRGKLRGKVPPFTPLSATSFHEAHNGAYYNLARATIPEQSECFASITRPFDGLSLVTVDTLQDTWPDAKWGHSKDQSQVMEVASTPQIENPTRSLQATSVDVFHEQLLDPFDDIMGLLYHAEPLPDYCLHLRRKLLAKAHTLQPSQHALILAIKAFEGQSEVDLSPFTTIPASGLHFIVIGLRENGITTTLNLSNRPDITERDLTTILSSSCYGSLKTIILLEAPQISLRFVTASLGHYNVLHSELLRLPLPKYGDYIDGHVSDPRLPLDFAAANKVSQLVCIGIYGMQAVNRRFRLENLKYDDCAWRSSRLVFFKFPVIIPLPPSKLTHNLVRTFQWLRAGATSLHCHWQDALSRVVAFAFATAPPRANGADYSVGPVSTAMYNDQEFREHRRYKSLKEGQWAVVIIHEALKPPNEIKS